MPAEWLPEIYKEPLYQAAMTIQQPLSKSYTKKKVEEFNLYRLAWRRLIVQEGFYKKLLLHNPHFWSKMRWCLFSPFFSVIGPIVLPFNTKIHSSPVYSQKKKQNLLLGPCG